MGIMGTDKIPRLSSMDPNSFSNPEKVRAEHIDLNWNLDFVNKIVTGTATFSLLASDSSVNELILDTKFLNIKRAFDDKGNTLKHSFGKNFKAFGQALKIKLPALIENKTKISVEYETTIEGTALKWLDKEMTAGKTHPYLFSQCQATYARSLLPCQDTPSTKATYSAEVSAPSELRVLMSAVGKGVEQKGKTTVYKFFQSVPIPTYLFAIVAGKLESVKVGPRSNVWTEKEYLDASAYEFDETESFLQAGEKLMGPYEWGVYDILVLPPSFPMGGMENPCLTFATPTLLAGDKSLAGVVAHEIAHSWTGNLVTNKNHEHFWLNEGFTMFAERKIIGTIKGEKNRQFESILGWGELEQLFREEMDPSHNFAKLIPDLTGEDPEDAFSKVPYEKGFAFLYYLEQKVGGPINFEPFFKQYIQDHRFKSIDSDTFKKYFINYFKQKGLSENIKDVDWDTWFYTPGMPPIKNQYDTTLADECNELNNLWTTSNVSQLGDEAVKKFKKMNSGQVIHFLALLLANPKPLGLEKLKKMQELYNLNSSKNSEIRFRWLRLGLKGRWKDQVPLAVKFITEQGRLKFVRPIYADLYNWEEEGRAVALDTYKKYKSSLATISQNQVGKVLKLIL